MHCHELTGGHANTQLPIFFRGGALVQIQRMRTRQFPDIAISCVDRDSHVLGKSQLVDTTHAHLIRFLSCLGCLQVLSMFDMCWTCLMLFELVASCSSC